ncbi:MAG: hypothetical protein RH859_04960 [Longimicrobiales bacterium]
MPAPRPNHARSAATAVLLTSALAWGPPAASAQSAPEIPYVCLSEPVPAQLSCAQRQAAFYAYLAQMGFGQALYSLPADWVDLLQDHFPNVDVGDWRFAFSDRQPPDNATTDCDRTYFNDQGFVDDLRQGVVTNHRWLLHEIAHYDQCIEVGGRDDFAKMWWDDLDLVTLQILLGQTAIDDLHDAMEMEDEAETMALDIRDEILDCCIHPETGDVIDPLVAGALTVSPSEPKVGEMVTVSVDPSAGAEPYFYTWRATRPDGVPMSRGDDDIYRFEARRAGAYRVSLRLAQGVELCQDEPETFSLPCHEDEVVVEVKPRIARVTSLELDDPVLDPGESTVARIHVTELPEGDDQDVTLSTSTSLVSVPDQVTVTGSGGFSGTASFDVEVPWDDETLLLGDRTVELTAGVGADPSLSASAKVTVRGYHVRGFEMVAVPDRLGREIYRIKVTLDRRVRVPVTLQLESSDPRSLAPPTTLTVPRGSSEAVVDVVPPRTLSKETMVTVLARHPSPAFTPREASVRVKAPRR